MGIWLISYYSSAVQLLFSNFLYGDSQLRAELRKGKIIFRKGGQQIKGASNTHHHLEYPNKCNCVQTTVSIIQKQIHR